MKQEYCDIIKAADKFLKEGEQPDSAMIAKEVHLKSEQVCHLMEEMDEQGLVIAFEIDMCCGEDYVINEITEKGKKVL